MKQQYLSIFLIMSLIATMQCSAGDENLAFNCPYTLDPAPNYEPATIGVNDLKDLTDGIFAPNEGQQWDYPQAVGWSNLAAPISITIDLKAEKVLNRVKFYTSGGSAGVNYPNIIDVEVSNDGKAFFELGCLTALNANPPPAPDAGYRKWTLDATFPAVKARFVRLRCVMMGHYLFTDEIEIFGIKGTAVSAEQLRPVVSDEVFCGNIDRRKTESCIRKSYENLLSDILRQNAAEPPPDDLKSAIKEWTYHGEMSNFSGVYPVDSVHERIFGLNASRLRKRLGSTVVFWPASPYDPVSSISVPDPLPREAVLKTAMMNGEQRLLALNLMNTTEKPVELDVSLQGLKGKLYQMEFLDSQSIRCTSTALRKINRPVKLFSGMTGQIIIELIPENLKAGVHRGILSLTGNERKITVPVEVCISNILFPSQVTVTTGGWDHLDFNDAGKSHYLDRKDLAEILQMQKDHRVNMTFGGDNLTKLSRPGELTIDDEGNLTFPVDFSRFDRWIEQWPDARYYNVFMGILPHYKFAGKAGRGTFLFNTAVKKWAQLWDEHIVKKNLQGRVMFHFLDEPRTQEQYETEFQWTKAFKAGAKHILVFSDPLQFSADDERSLQFTDIECPLVSMVMEDRNGESELYRRRIAARDRKYWFYRCSAGPFNADTSYFRNQYWSAFAYGMDGSLFWGFNDFGGTPNSYNQYLTRTVYFSPMLFDASGVHPTKHLKAMRDGIQDFEYLTMLRKAIADANASDIDTEEQEKLLNDSLSEVAKLEKMGIEKGAFSPSSLAEQKRLTLLKALEELDKKLHP